jgi:hypothetical protein
LETADLCCVRALIEKIIEVFAAMQSLAWKFSERCCGRAILRQILVAGRATLGLASGCLGAQVDRRQTGGRSVSGVSR